MRTVGVRRRSVRRETPAASPSRGLPPVELVGGERRALAARAHGRRRRPATDAPEARAGGAPDDRLDDDLQPRLAPRLGRARTPAAGRRRACGPASRRPAAPGGPTASAGERRRGATASRPRTPGRPTPRSPARGRAPIPRWPSDCRRPSRRRTRPRRAAGSSGRPPPTTGRRTAASRTARRARPRRPAAGARRSPAPSAISSRWRDRESTSNGRPSGPIMSTRCRPAASQSSQPRAGGAPGPWIVSVPLAGVGRDDRERPADRQPAGLDGAHVDVLARRARPRRSHGRATRSATGPGRPRGARRAPRRPRASAPRAGGSGLASDDRSAAPVAVDRLGAIVVGRRPRRPPSAALRASASSAAASSSSSRSGRDARERLGERVGEVAEDVGRVVELDELVGAGRARATRRRCPRAGPRRGTCRSRRARAARRRRRR